MNGGRSVATRIDRLCAISHDILGLLQVHRVLTTTQLITLTRRPEWTIDYRLIRLRERRQHRAAISGQRSRHGPSIRYGWSRYLLGTACVGQDSAWQSPASIHGWLPATSPTRLAASRNGGRPATTPATAPVGRDIPIWVRPSPADRLEHGRNRLWQRGSLSASSGARTKKVGQPR